MSKKILFLSQFEQKITIFKLIILISLITFSCNKPIQNKIYGKWTDIENKYVVLIIDSISDEITIDYSCSGGKVFVSKYLITPENEIISNLFPYGAKFIIDENGYLRINQTKKIYSRDLEIVYSLKFKKIEE